MGAELSDSGRTLLSILRLKRIDVERNQAAGREYILDEIRCTMTGIHGSAAVSIEIATSTHFELRLTTLFHRADEHCSAFDPSILLRMSTKPTHRG